MFILLSPCPYPCPYVPLPHVHIPVPMSLALCSHPSPRVHISVPAPCPGIHPCPYVHIHVPVPVPPGLTPISLAHPRVSWPPVHSYPHTPVTQSHNRTPIPLHAPAPCSGARPRPRVPTHVCAPSTAAPQGQRGEAGGGAGPQPIRTRAPRLASPARQSARRPHGNLFPAPELLRPGTAPPAAGTRFLPGKDPFRGPPLPTRRHGKPSQGPSRLQPSPGAGGGGGTTRGAEEEAALQQRHGGSVRTALNAAPALLGSAPRMRFPARFAYERPLAAGRAPGVSPRRGQGAGVGRGSTGVYWAVLGCAGLCAVHSALC